MKKLLLTIMFVLFTSTAKAQTIAADTTVLQKLVHAYVTKDYDHMACLRVHQDATDSTIMVIDSVLGFQAMPPCPTTTNGLAGVADSGLTQATADRISQELLNAFPNFILVCAMVGTKSVEDKQITYTVPEFWCTKRQENNK